VHVRGPEGVRTSRKHYRLLRLRGTLGPDARPHINGHPWDSPDALALIKRAAGDDAWLEADESLGRFDILPLLVAPD
jgi:MOSC domain-containing protein